jgi:hypothetical protein
MSGDLFEYMTFQLGNRLQIGSRSRADGGTRTRTDLSVQRILSPLRLPFRHIGARPGSRMKPRAVQLQVQTYELLNRCGFFL